MRPYNSKYLETLVTKESKTIKVWFGTDLEEIPESSISFVGGTEGVFATYKNGDQISFLSGDDGHWWHMGTYHIDWCEGISKNIYQYVSKGRRK